MVHWTEMETIMVPDRHDHPDTEFYGMPVFYYEGFRIGLVWIFRTTNTLHVMSWQGRNDVSRLAGQTVRLRFSMKNAKLYSFQFR